MKAELRLYLNSKAENTVEIWCGQKVVATIEAADSIFGIRVKSSHRLTTLNELRTRGQNTTFIAIEIEP